MYVQSPTDGHWDVFQVFFWFFFWYYQNTEMINCTLPSLRTLTISSGKLPGPFSSNPLMVLILRLDFNPPAIPSISCVWGACGEVHGCAGHWLVPCESRGA